MSKYCDPRVLEATWLNWSVANSIPSLEPIRESGLLYTQRSGDNGKWLHLVASVSPCKFASINGKIAPLDLDAATRSSFYPLDTAMLHETTAGNYLHEEPIDLSWRSLTLMIYQICCGIVLKFRPRDEEIKNELIHEAFTNTLTKIQRGKLQFTPGRAPAFNLLTTAIFRIMYSIKNKEKRDRNHRSQLVEKLLCGAQLPDLNSIRVSQSTSNYASKI